MVAAGLRESIECEDTGTGRDGEVDAGDGDGNRTDVRERVIYLCLFSIFELRDALVDDDDIDDEEAALDDAVGLIHEVQVSFASEGGDC
jgi:hypothetical protein